MNSRYPVELLFVRDSLKVKSKVMVSSNRLVRTHVPLRATSNPEQTTGAGVTSVVVSGEVVGTTGVVVVSGVVVGTTGVVVTGSTCVSTAPALSILWKTEVTVKE